MQSALQQMMAHCAVVAKAAGVKVANDAAEIRCNCEQRNATIGYALKELAAQHPPIKMLEVLQSILRTQRLCLELFERVHKLDCNLHSVSEEQRASRPK
jgi:hypothetical protein